MREKYLEEMIISIIVAAVGSLIITDAIGETVMTFVGIWMLMVMIVWGIIAEVKKRLP